MFIENNAANVADHLHIDYATLSTVNPKLIMVRFPGFGTVGPYRHFKGYGTIMEGVAGHTLLYFNSLKCWLDVPANATRWARAPSSS